MGNMDEILLEENSENLLEENADPVNKELEGKQKALIEQLQKELEAAKVQREALDKRMKEADAARKKAEAAVAAEKAKAEAQAKAKAKAEAEAKAKAKAEKERKQAQEEKRRESLRRIKAVLPIIGSYAVLVIHISFLLWAVVDLASVNQSILIFLFGYIGSGFASYILFRSLDEYDHEYHTAYSGVYGFIMLCSWAFAALALLYGLISWICSLF